MPPRACNVQIKETCNSTIKKNTSKNRDFFLFYLEAGSQENFKYTDL